MDDKASNTKSKSSSILKPPKQRQPFSEVHYDSSFEAAEGTTIANRRVSFAEKKHVKEFCDSLEQGTVWDNTYEESDLSSMHVAVTSNSNLSSNEILSENTVEDTDSPTTEIVSEDTGNRHVLEDDKKCNATHFFHDASLEMTEIPLSSIQTQMCNKTILFPNVSMEMTDVYMPVPQETNDIEVIDLSMEITEVVPCTVPDLYKKSNHNKTVVYHDDSMEMTCALQPPLSNKIRSMNDDDNDRRMEFTMPVMSLPLTKSGKHSGDNDKENCIQNETRILHESMMLTEMVPRHIVPQACVDNVGNNDCPQDMKNEATKIFQNESMTLTKILPSKDFDWKHADKENDPCRSIMTNVNMSKSLTFTELVQSRTSRQLNHEDTIKDSTIHLTKIFDNESMTFTNVLPSVAVCNNHEVIGDIPNSRDRDAPSKCNEYHEMSMELTSAVTGLHSIPYQVKYACNNEENAKQCNKKNPSENNKDHEMSMELTSAVTDLHFNSGEIMKASIDKENINHCDEANVSEKTENHASLMELTNAITNIRTDSNEILKAGINKKNIKHGEQSLSQNNENHEISMELFSLITNLHSHSNEVMKADDKKKNVIQCEEDNLSQNNENHEMSMKLTSAITNLRSDLNEVMKADNNKENIVQCDEENLSQNNENHEMSMELTSAITNIHSDPHEVMKADIGKANAIQCEKQNPSRNNEYHDMLMELTSAITGLHSGKYEAMEACIDKENTVHCSEQNVAYFEENFKKSKKFLEEIDDEEQHFFRKSLTLSNDSADELQLIEPPSLICTDSMMRDSFCEDAQILQNSMNSDNLEKATLDIHQERSIETLSQTHEARRICGEELNVSQDAQNSQRSLPEDELTDISMASEKDNIYNASVEKENVDIEVVNQESHIMQLSSEVPDLSVNLDPFSRLIKNVKDHAQRDDCIWNVFAECTDRKMIATSFISNSLVVAIFLDVTVKQIEIISRLLDDNDECVKMVHRIIREKLDVHELKDTYAFYEDVLPLLTHISREVMLAMDFMFDLKRLKDLNLMEITENRVSFVSRAKKMKIILKVTINIKPFDTICRRDITVCTLLGSVRENDIKDLFMSIKKDYMFLRRYMEDVQTYIELMELT